MNADALLTDALVGVLLCRRQHGRKEYNKMDRWFYIYNELKRKVESHEELILDPTSDACQLFNHIAGDLKGKRDFALIKHLETSQEFIRQHIERTDVRRDGTIQFLMGFESAIELLLYAARRR